MKLRTIGTGSKFCRYPLTPSSFIISTGENIVLIGAPWGIAAALDKYGYSIDNISVITFLSPQSDQIAGLSELAVLFKHKKKRPILSAPAKLIGAMRSRIEPELGFFLDESFDLKPSVKIHIKEDFFSEVAVFVQSYLDPSVPSYSLRLENAKIFITGETTLNEDWLFKEIGNDLILHSCRNSLISGGVSPIVTELQDLPMYLQTKMWLYGYDASAKNMEPPFPMMYLPPGSWIFDSERRDRLLSKDRFIRENSKKQN